MTLTEAAARLSDFSDDLTIYIERGAQTDGASEVTVAAASEDDSAWAPSGFRYLLEVDVAKEVVEVWTAWRNGQVPTAEDAARAITYYVEHDTYEPAVE